MDRTLLTRALATGRVAVHADCRAETVRTRADRVVGLSGSQRDPKTLKGAGMLEVRANDFVVSGGSVGSPRFLLSNGLGDPQTAGHRLRFHPATGAMALFDHEIRPWEGVTQGYYVDFQDEGFLLETYTVTPDQYFITMAEKIGNPSLDTMANLAHLASSGVMATGWDSEGKVGMKGLTFHLSDKDKNRLLLGLRRTAEAFFAAGAKKVFLPIAGSEALVGPDGLDRSVPDSLRAMDLTVYCSHIMGSCRMGLDPLDSVVDPRGRVWGWKNLYVSDASVFPGSLGVNPQITTMATGLMIGAGIA